VAAAYSKKSAFVSRKSSVGFAEMMARMQADLASWNALVAATGFERI
jgi:hypothetical protein